MSYTTWITLSFVPALFFLLWHLTSSFLPPVPLTLRNKRIILLIAHPDDESMFFSPTLQALTSPALQNHLKILCMSTGDSEGLGETRKQELEKAALTLGVRRREDVFVLDDERFRDGMKEDWKAEDISRVLASAFAPHINTPSANTPQRTTPEPESKESKKSKSSKSLSTKSKSSVKSSPTSTPPPQATPEGPRATIDVLITFDSLGISSHPNHIALYHGAKLFLSKIMKGHSGYASPVTLYTLPTVNIVRKYSFIFDTIPTLLFNLYASIFTQLHPSPSSPSTARSHDKRSERVIFVSDGTKYWKAREAMTRGHVSQMVWFRWGWIGLGRYMVVNDLVREKVVAT
jgi:N-acetylglucosaminylphosphatidylinositol deacetylase